MALKSAARLEQLLDIPELSKLETDGVCIQAVSFSPAVLLEHMRDLFALAASQKGLRFGRELDARVPEKLIGDEVRVRQIFIPICWAMPLNSQPRVLCACVFLNHGAPGNAFVVCGGRQRNWHQRNTVTTNFRKF